MNFRIEAGNVVGLVSVEKGTIKQTPPIWSVFKGQPFANLLEWLHKNAREVKIESIGWRK